MIHIKTLVDVIFLGCKMTVHEDASTIQDGPKVRRQTATTHGGGSGESFEVGNPCPETHRYAPVSTFLERMNACLAMSHNSGQRARSGMRFSFVSFHSNAACLCSSMVPCRPKVKNLERMRGLARWIIKILFNISFFSAKSLLYLLHFTLFEIEFDPLSITWRVKWQPTAV